jgi:hypothetical protein
MKEYTNLYAKKIHDILVPLVGSLVAQSFLKLNATKIGKTEETLVRSDLQAISEGIKKGLLTFVGTDAANKIAIKISEII